MEHNDQHYNDLSSDSLLCYKIASDMLCQNCSDLDVPAALQGKYALEHGIIARKSDATVPWVWTTKECCSFGRLLVRCQSFERPLPLSAERPCLPRKPTWLRVYHPENVTVDPYIPVIEIVFSCQTRDFGSIQALKLILRAIDRGTELAFGLAGSMSVIQGQMQAIGPYRLIPPFTDEYDSIQEHIRRCQLSHKSSCGINTFDSRLDIRLIDCATLKVVKSSQSWQYLALSYVWGRDGQNETGIHDSEGKLTAVPKTIEDAISVTLRLGFRYLWVDRYCIRQDDEVDFRQQIRQMHQVYRLAEATIVAVAGRDPTFGLPGVSSPRSVSQLKISIDNLLFTSLPAQPWDSVHLSFWNRRGWTYQELLFSRRRILFTEDQVIFDCGQGWKCESLRRNQLLQKHHTWTIPWQSQVPSQSPRSQDTDLIVYQFIHNYSRRELTFERDIINAFSGVLGACKPLNVGHHWGIPLLIRARSSLASFIFGLTWNFHYLCSVESPGIRRKRFPSWSWTGWFCPTTVDFRTEDFRDGNFRLPSGTDIKIEMNNGLTLTWTEFERAREVISVTLDASPYIILYAWAISIQVVFREDKASDRPFIADGYIGKRSHVQGPLWMFLAPEELDLEFKKDENGQLKYLGILLSDICVCSYGFPIVVLSEKEGFWERVGFTYLLDEDMNSTDQHVYSWESFMKLKQEYVRFRRRKIRLG